MQLAVPPSEPAGLGAARHTSRPPGLIIARTYALAPSLACPVMLRAVASNPPPPTGAPRPGQTEQSGSESDPRARRATNHRRRHTWRDAGQATSPARASPVGRAASRDS